MKKLLMLLVLAGSMPLASMAQDDVYFTPSKEDQAPQSEKPAYYSGSKRNVDEYNRYGKLNSYYQKIGTDSLGNDIITFQPGYGYKGDSVTDTAYVYPGSAKFSNDDEYMYTRRMARWDGFYDPWFYDYYGPYGWYSPWYYGSWYGGWYDPWYYGYAGWYDPWYYGYYGWGRPYRYGWYDLWWPSYYNDYRYTGGHAGTANHWAYSGRGFNKATGYTPSYGGRSASGNFSGYRGGTNNAGSNNARSYSVRNNSRFGSNRSYSDFNRVPSNRSYSTPSSSFGGGFTGGTRGGFSGGTRGGGFSGGGSRGGGSFGGRR